MLGSRWLWGVMLIALVAMGRPAPAGELPEACAYPFGGESFGLLLADSAQVCGEDGDFCSWLEERYRQSGRLYPGHQDLPLAALLCVRRQEIAALPTVAARAKAQADLAGWLHGLVKALLPRFSLSRGFEFAQAMRYGERQCFLQSTLLSALLQEAGVEAGVVMVFRNSAGGQSNNGHAAVMLKLPTGRDLLVDASAASPFSAHQGVFAWLDSYRYLVPIYAADRCHIKAYRPAGESHGLPPEAVTPLDFDFVRAAFWFYRGEQHSGLAAGAVTPARLAAAEQMLLRSLEICPDNPLAVYTLGRIWRLQGKLAPYRTALELARHLYRQAGWVPPGVVERLTEIAKRP